jgi:hypothetical protein
MARTEHVIANRLRGEARAPWRSALLKALVCGAVAIVASFALGGHLLAPAISLGFAVFLVVLLGFAVLFLARSARKQIVAAGAEGEDHAMSILQRLPDTYALFNQLDIPNSRSSRGVNEADVVVCGPSAIFVIEVKHNNGTIICDEQAPRWKVLKVGRRGGVYEKDMRNPIAQTKTLVWLLSEHLKKSRSKPWIQGVVVFTNPDAELQILGAPSVPVLRATELLDYIETYHGTSRPQILARSMAELAKLRGVALAR